MTIWRFSQATDLRGTSGYNYCETIHAWRWSVVGAFLLVGALACWQAAQMRSTIDNRVFFGPENPELSTLNAFEKDYSQNNDVLVGVELKSSGIFTREGLTAVRDLTEQLWRAPFATRVDSLSNYQHSVGAGDSVEIGDLVPPHFGFSPSDIARVRQIALSEPLLTHLLISPDGQVAGVRANFQFPRDDAASVKRITDYLRQLEADFKRTHPGAELYFTGNVMVMDAFGEAQQRDVKFLIPMMLIVMGGVLYLLLRSWAGAAIALTSSIATTLLTMGIASALGIVMSAGSAPAPFIVFTVALAYNVHIISEFVDSCRMGASRRAATLTTVEANAFAIFLTGLTTGVGFWSMNSSDPPPFHDLGNMAAVGVGVGFVVAFTLTPALLSIVNIPVDRRSSRVDAVLRYLAKIITRQPGKILGVLMVLLFVLAAGMFQMRVTENWVAYFDETFQFRRDTDAVLHKLTGFDVLEFSIPAKSYGGIESPEYMRKLDAFTGWLRTQGDVLNVISVSDLLKHVNKNLHSDDPKYDAVPASRAEIAQYLLLYEMSLPKGVNLNDRITSSRQASRVTVVVGRNGKNLPSDQLLPLAQSFEGWLQDHKVASKGTGLSLIFAHLAARNTSMMVGGTLLAMLIVSLILIVGLRSVPLSIIAMVGDMAPSVMALGLWGHLVSEMNLAVSIVASMTFGVVVDDTIHYVTKYSRARRVLGMTPDQAVEYAFASMGKAMIFTMTVMCCGFAVLAESSFGVNATLGVVAVITFAFAVVADTFILAPLLLICDRSFKMFAWHPARRLDSLSETPALRARVDAYIERMRDGHIVVGRPPGPDAVQLWSNDYLGLGGHRDIVKAQVAHLEETSESVFMSAVFLNATSLQHQFEQEMASYLNAEATVLCQSGWAANTGLIQALVDKRTPVYLDQFAHASLWDGAQMAGAKAYPFRHNRLDHLARLIKQHGAGLVLVDAVYSAYGTICPLAEIADLCEREGCILVVDESHSVGVYGEHGEGLVSSMGLLDKVHYRTFSLSKAFAVRAGMVAGPKRVMDYFPFEAKPAIFSSAVLQHEVAGLFATLKAIKTEGWRRDQLWQNVRYLRDGLLQLGYAVDQSDSQIVALQSGTEPQTRAFRDALEERGVFGAVFAAPATAKKHCILRLSVNSRLSKADLDRVIAACGEIARDRLVNPWPKDLLRAEPPVKQMHAKIAMAWGGFNDPIPVAGQ